MSRRILIALPLVAAAAGAVAAYTLAWLIDQIDQAEAKGMSE